MNAIIVKLRERSLGKLNEVQFCEAQGKGRLGKVIEINFIASND